MTDYNPFAATFSQSRKTLKWPEIEYFLAKIPEFFPSKQKLAILDVGCGNGRLLTALENAGIEYEYFGIDASSGMIEEARKIHPGEDLRTLPMELLGELKSRFNIIFFIASFHHLDSVESRKQTLQSAFSLLKDEGVVMMTNWNLLGDAWFPKYTDVHRGKGDFDIKIGAHSRYYHGFTTEELDELFQEVGYEILENREFEEGKNIISILWK